MDHIKILLSPGQNVNEKTFNNYDTFKKKKKKKLPKEYM